MLHSPQNFELASAKILRVLDEMGLRPERKDMLVMCFKLSWPTAVTELVSGALAFRDTGSEWRGHHPEETTEQRMLKIQSGPVGDGPFGAYHLYVHTTLVERTHLTF